MTDTPNDPNHSLERRREARAAEHLVQDSVSRMTDVMTAQMEVWQKIAAYWADSFNIAQQSFGRIIDTVQQQRRSA